LTKAESKVKLAEEFAKEKHKHMMRKDGKTPYWKHLERVVENLTQLGIEDNEMLCAGWLHDTIEDTNTDFEEISDKFELNVAEIVAQVTKDNRLDRKQREQEYIRQLKKASWQAQAIKLCDILANLSDLSNMLGSVEKKSKVVSDKMKYFDTIREGLIGNKSKIPHPNIIVEEINAVLKEYGKSKIVL
jgi:guanosine-3',5'-bis(diphosphate) 3'-pyrophosphohydrolase